MKLVGLAADSWFASSKGIESTAADPGLGGRVVNLIS